jgi:hypothetical protein
MEILFNNGTAFFSIVCPNFDGPNKDAIKMITPDVISFSITEELGKLVSGSLSLRDPSGIYAKFFRCGRKLEISFGYKSWNQNIAKLGINISSSRGRRQGIHCMVQTPSGAGDEGGQTIYNATFMGLELLKGIKYAVYESQTYADMISQLMQDIDIPVENQIIDFSLSKEKISIRKPITQRDTSLSFLHEKANNWNVLFRYGVKPDGTKMGLFVDSVKMKSLIVKGFFNSVYGVDDEKDLYYNCGQLSNIKSFDWQQHIGESGQGDGVSITYVEGQPVFQRYVLESGTVKLYQLNKERVRRATANGANIQKDTEILSATDFQQVIKYFDPVNSSTAPQGQGFTVNVKAHGDPFFIPLTKINFAGGFPPPLTQSILQEIEGALVHFYIKKVTHTFTKGEFGSDLEICDRYGANGSMIGPQTLEEAVGPGIQK